jgi:hypothetical protein
MTVESLTGLWSDLKATVEALSELLDLPELPLPTVQQMMIFRCVCGGGRLLCNKAAHSASDDDLQVGGCLRGGVLCNKATHSAADDDLQVGGGRGADRSCCITCSRSSSSSGERGVLGGEAAGVGTAQAACCAPDHGIPSLPFNAATGQ